MLCATIARRGASVAKLGNARVARNRGRGGSYRGHTRRPAGYRTTSSTLTIPRSPAAREQDADTTGFVHKFEAFQQEKRTLHQRLDVLYQWWSGVLRGAGTRHRQRRERRFQIVRTGHMMLQDACGLLGVGGGAGQW